MKNQKVNITPLFIRTKKDAVKITHTLSNPQKMPCKGYSLPASQCGTGGKLQSIKGSVCYNCYAMKGCYQFPVVKDALQKRLDSINHPLWVDAMIKNISGSAFFRWHDSGDINSEAHFINILKIAEKLPNTRFWIPTKEKAIVRRVLKRGYSIPENLIVRYSMPMVNDTPRAIHKDIQLSVSITSEKEINGKLCMAYKNDGKCGKCRDCWNKDILNINYLMH